MTIAKGDVLLFEDTGSVATVIGGGPDTWQALIEEHGTVQQISNTDAAPDQATFGDTPSGRPAVGTFVHVFFADNTASKWRVDGYATTPAFGSGTVYAVLTNVSNPAQTCYVTDDLVFPAS